MVTEHERQRRIEILDEADARHLPRARRLHRLVDRRIEVDRRAGDRLAPRKMLHLVDQCRDPVDLGADECREAFAAGVGLAREELRSEEHTSALQSLMRTSFADLCLNKKRRSSELTSD